MFPPGWGEPGLIEEERLPLVQSLQRAPVVLGLGHDQRSYASVVGTLPADGAHLQCHTGEPLASPIIRRCPHTLEGGVDPGIRPLGHARSFTVQEQRGEVADCGTFLGGSISILQRACGSVTRWSSCCGAREEARGLAAPVSKARLLLPEAAMDWCQWECELTEGLA